ncbi:hypothetical protein JX265_003113 [Neoarthrinium moseri]|uniref:FAD-binding PCMH-type domain-containing protein n=1 Tax=Neoarthrinium moseri TaxID=1658444 RepID=A0A9Q0AT00_9PEZI|nr:hypothetical protein JX265_003113 [Neoarthrinium moseri]
MSGAVSSTQLGHSTERKTTLCGNYSFAIRSGGHLPAPGAANIDDGILIDLSRFDRVQYDAAKSLVSVGSGQRWGNVYSQLDQHNVTVVGGRVLDVGVGGLTLGSGLSYLSDLYGMVCDNVVSFEVVLANGSVVHASGASNQDLFWALKGGSNSFGIVTNLVLKTYPIQHIWGGIKGYTLDQLPSLLDALLEYQSAPSKERYANLMMQGFVTNATIGIALSVIYLKPEESPSVFKPFYNISTAYDTTKLQTLYEFSGSQGAVSLPRVEQRATSFKPTANLYDKLLGILTESPSLETIRSVTAGPSAFGLQPISSSPVEAGRSQGGNALGLEAVNQTWVIMDSGWWFSDDDEPIHRATQDIVDSIENAPKEEGQYVEYIFINDADWDQDVIGHYGTSNVKRLKMVQDQYDPDHVFQRLVLGGFKLPYIV